MLADLDCWHFLFHESEIGITPQSFLPCSTAAVVGLSVLVLVWAILGVAMDIFRIWRTSVRGFAIMMTPIHVMFQLGNSYITRTAGFRWTGFGQSTYRQRKLNIGRSFWVSSPPFTTITTKCFHHLQIPRSTLDASFDSIPLPNLSPLSTTFSIAQATCLIRVGFLVGTTIHTYVCGRVSAGYKNN